MTKITFVAHRANYLKHYGPVIDAALRRGWNVECWLQPTVGGGKAHLGISPETVQAIWDDKVNVLEFEEHADVIDLAKQRKPDAIVSLHPRHAYGSGDNSQFLTLQHSVDSFVEAGPEELASSDTVCLFSPYWLDYAARYYEMSGVADRAQVEMVLEHKVAYTGFAQMDGFAKIDKNEVRERWGVPADQPVLLVLPIDLAGWPGAWPGFFAAKKGRKQWKNLLDGTRQEGIAFAAEYTSWAVQGWNDEALAEAFRRFCKKNGAYLLVKGREKHPLRRAWLERADKAFYDTAHYPATIFEAIAISSACVVFYSTAAQEAAYACVPSLCLDRPNKDIVKHKLWRSSEIGGPYNYPGVANWTTIPETIQNLPDKSFDDFQINAEARNQYLEKFNGPADYKASERILDLVN